MLSDCQFLSIYWFTEMNVTTSKSWALTQTIVEELLFDSLILQPILATQSKPNILSSHQIRPHKSQDFF